jgi:hypothetical protein
MHLSFLEIPVNYQQYPRIGKFRDDVGELDDLFFYSVPTSLFVLNNKIPRVLRELFAEAEGCLKSNFLTGASACARKIVYELAKREEAEGNTYEDRINSLKAKKPEVDPTYFDTLSTIQQLTSNKVHENAYDHWEAKHLRLILATLSEILYEIYVIPELRRDKRRTILDLKAKIMGGKEKTESNSSSDEDSKGG